MSFDSNSAICPSGESKSERMERWVNWWIVVLVVVEVLAMVG